MNSVKLSNEVERERTLEQAKAREKITWEIYRTRSIVEAVHKARDAGWFEGKVQVRAERAASDEFEYVIEPYEEGCGCSGRLNFADYFDPPQHG